MDIFPITTPIDNFNSNSLNFPSNSSESIALKNKTFTNRFKLCNLKISPNDINSLINYSTLLESYINDLSLLITINYPCDSSNLLQMAQQISLQINSIPWKKLPITINNNIETNYNLYSELTISIISLSNLLFKIGILKIYQDCYLIDIKNLSIKIKDEKNSKWVLITNNYFKKAVSMVTYLQESSLSIDNDNKLFEVSSKFIEFWFVYLNCNLQLISIIIRNFWNERFEMILQKDLKGDGLLLNYELSDLNDGFLIKNNYNLLIKISTFVFNELKNLNDLILGFQNDFEENNNNKNFKNLVNKFKNFDSNDIDNDEILNLSNNLLKSLLNYSNFFKVFSIYLKIYLVKYLSLQNFIKKDNIGFAISLINFAINNKNEMKIKKLNFLKKSSNDFMSSNLENTDKFELIDKKIKKKLLTSNNLLILNDFNNLMINLKNLNYKLIIQNNNLSFERLEDLNFNDFTKLLPLGKSMPINLSSWSPLDDLDNSIETVY